MAGRVYNDWLNDPTPDGVDPWRVNPLIHIVRHTVSFIKGLYAQCPEGAYRWDPATDDSPAQGGSEIFIASDTPIDTKEYVGFRPAITVVRGPAAFRGIGLNDQAYVDLSTGAVSKMDIIPTTIFINVLSRIPYEAEQLAWFTGSNLWNLRSVFMKNQSGILFMGNRPTYNSVSPAGSLVVPDTEHNWVTASVSFPVYLQHSAHRMPLHCGPGTGIVQEVETVASVVRPEQTETPEARIPLQGSAVMQPQVQPPTVSTGTSLPSNTANEVQSSDEEPLTVTIKS